MFTAKIILDYLTDKGMVNTLIGVMAENLQDFAEDQKRYLDAMGVLQTELGDDISPCVQDEVNAIEKQAASRLLFSGLLGMKANLDNFINPIARNFLEVDSDVYLREEAARRLPEYQNAQNTRSRFYAQLSSAQRKTYEDVIPYTSHLETAGPKLAHYYGYIFANAFLPRVIPGYYTDTVQTARYTAMTNEYFGKHILQTVL